MKKVMLVCLVIIMTGCASRKKEVQQHKEAFHFNSAVDTAFSFKSAYRFQLDTHAQEQSLTTVTKVKYDGKKGDSLSIKKFGPDGKLQSETLITGSGKADLTEEKNSETRDIQAKSDVQSQVDRKASGHRKGTLQSLQVDNNKTLTTKGIAWGFWLVCLIILLILIGRWYLSKVTKNGV